MGPAGRDRRMRAESRQPGRVADDESESKRCDVEVEPASSSVRREPDTRSQQTSPSRKRGRVFYQWSHTSKRTNLSLFLSLLPAIL